MREQWALPRRDLAIVVTEGELDIRGGEPGGDAGMMVRGQMRTDLVAAMRAKDRDRVMALRSVLAALDDAEAVEVQPGSGAESGGPIAGANAGVGSTEVARRVLLPDDVRAVLMAEVTERESAATEYTRIKQAEVAARLRREADVLRPYLAMDEF